MTAACPPILDKRITGPRTPPSLLLARRCWAGPIAGSPSTAEERKPGEFRNTDPPNGGPGPRTGALPARVVGRRAGQYAAAGADERVPSRRVCAFQCHPTGFRTGTNASLELNAPPQSWRAPALRVHTLVEPAPWRSAKWMRTAPPSHLTLHRAGRVKEASHPTSHSAAPPKSEPRCASASEPRQRNPKRRLRLC